MAHTIGMATNHHTMQAIKRNNEMAIRKNKKRIDPRYFLHETTHRDLEEQEGMQSNVSAKIDAVNAELKNITDSAELQGRDINMYIELVSDGAGQTGEGPVIEAFQQNAEMEIVARSRWTKFSDFLKLFAKLPKDGNIMYELEDAADSSAYPTASVPRGY